MDARLDPHTYVDDPPVRITRTGTDDEVYAPERLWARLCWLGSAYELHHLPRLHEGPSSHRLNDQQCAVLLGELDLLALCVIDRATLALIEQLRPTIERASHAGSAGLTIE